MDKVKIPEFSPEIMAADAWKMRLPEADSEGRRLFLTDGYSWWCDELRNQDEPNEVPPGGWPMADDCLLKLKRLADDRRLDACPPVKRHANEEF